MCMKGNDDVIELLLTKGRAKVDQVDTAGNTALLCAAKVGNVATMCVLVDHGASIDAQNKIGETVWHYAMRQDDDTLLKAVAGLYRKAKHFDRTTKIIKFYEGCNPLQVFMIGRVLSAVAFSSNTTCSICCRLVDLLYNLLQGLQLKRHSFDLLWNYCEFLYKSTNNGTYRV
jgi:Ankyrin repeats (3 copies)